MKELKMAIIGCGPRATRHAGTYAKIDNARVVACCDRNKDKVDSFAAKYRCISCSDPVEMIKEEKVTLPFDPPEDLFEKMGLMKYVDPLFKEYVEKNIF